MLTRILQIVQSKAKQIAILIGIVILALIGYSCARKHAKKANAIATSTVLQPNQEEKIIINAPKHQITVVTPTGTKTQYFSDNITTVTENKNGKLDIYSPTWDFGIHPTVSFGFYKPRLMVGISPIGYKKLDLNISVETDCTHLTSTALNTSIGYNVHNSTYLFVGVNNHRTVEGGLRFRF